LITGQDQILSFDQDVVSSLKFTLLVPTFYSFSYLNVEHLTIGIA